MDSTLGERIRARRQRKKWTLKDLARETDLSVPYLSDIERDVDANPTLRNLERIASALGTSVSGLTAGDGPSDPQSKPPLSVSMQRFVRSSTFDAGVKQLADRAGRDAKEMEQEVIDFLAHAPKRSQGELSPQDWRRLLDFYSAIILK